MFKKSKSIKIMIICIAVLISVFGYLYITKMSDNNMVKTLSKNNKFLFRDINWLSTKEQVLKHEGIKEKDTKITKGQYGITIESNKQQKFSETKLNIHTLYEFENNKFIIGRYYISTDNKPEFVNTCKK